jgi:drug/metabolite transporter (DMT)-like permease
MPSPRSSVASGVAPVDLGMLLFLGAVWGGAYLALRIAAPEVGPIWAAIARTGIAALVLVVVAGPRTWRAARGRLGAFVAVSAAFSAVPFTLIAFASMTLPAGMGALLNASTPMFTAALSAVWLGQRLGPRALAGLGVGVVAVLVLVGWSPLPLDRDTMVAVVAALAASLSYAVAGTFVRRHLPDVGGLELATGQLVGATLLLAPLAILSGPPAVPSNEAVVALVALGVVSTALAWPVFFHVLRRTTPTAASTVTFIVPAFGMAWGALLLAEPVGASLLIGFGLVIVSVVLVLGLPVPGATFLRARAASAGRAIPRSATA